MVIDIVRVAYHTPIGRTTKRFHVGAPNLLSAGRLSLAGAMESAFCALALREGFIPGNAHLSEVDPECAGLNLPRTTENRQANIVVKNSSGFGGANVAIVFKRVA